VALVLSNWHNVLRAISMASSKALIQSNLSFRTDRLVVKIPRPKDGEENKVEETKDESEIPLPQTLVRIPTEHAPMLQQAEGDSGE
jgi:DASH complex subunit DAD2